MIASPQKGPNAGRVARSHREGQLSSKSRLRFAVVSLLVATGALAFAGSSRAAAQGGYHVDASECPAGYCAIRMTRADTTRSNVTWTVPSSTFGYEWIGAQNTQATACSPPANPYGCIVQVGYAKYTPAGAPGICNVGTGGDIKVLYYALYGNGYSQCDISDFTVGANEDHTVKVARCGGTDNNWCTYLDGALKHTYVGPTGIGATAPQAAVSGEFGCDGCMDASTYIGSYWGSSGSGYAWQVGDGNTSANIPSGATHQFNTYTCGSGSHSSWHIDAVAPSAKWLINWSNGGTSC